MSATDLTAKANRFVDEVLNKGNLDRFTEYFSTDYVDHAVPPSPDFPTGVAGFKMFFGGLRQAFPDFRYTVEDTIVDGDHIVQRLTGHGTMKNAFMGMPATGKHADWSEIHDVRMGPDGKFVEHWVNVDQMGMLMQLGLAPTPGAS